jgi:hypothetical protein
MTAHVINPFPTFIAKDGAALDGHAHFGQPNQNPATNPVPVYWDPGLTQPAAQPVPIQDGYFRRNGDPARLWTPATTYSLRVTDASGPVIEAPEVRAGSEGVWHRPIGGDGRGVSVQAKLDYLGSYLPEHANPNDAPGSAHALQFHRAVSAGADRRTGPPGAPSYGFGRVGIPKGIFHSAEGFQYPADGLYGLNIEGVNAFASALTTDSPAAVGLKLNGYDGVRLADFHIVNKANSRVPALTDTSAGVSLVTGTGNPGGLLTLERLVIDGYHTAIRQDPSNAVNGDKTLVVGCGLGGQYVYDQGTNTQAIGWTFLNNGASARRAHFRLGGAGETLIANHTGDVPNTFIEFPEGAGNGGTVSDTNYFGSRTTVMSTKLEYQSSSVRMVDASACLLLTNKAGTDGVPLGASCDVVFRETSIARGFPVDSASNAIFVVGDTAQGSDAIRIKCEGGSIPGAIKVGSAKTFADGHETRWWSFRDMILAPNPATVQFLGDGHHYAMEWRRNESVPLDQYRGGQGGNVTIDSRKSYLVPTQGKYLIDGRVQGYKSAISTDAGTRYGRDFVIDLPNTGRAADQMGGIGHATVAQLGLSVWIENPTNGEHASEVRVEQFADPGFSIRIGDPKTIPGVGGTRGLFRVHSLADPHNIDNGKLYVRITKPAPDQWSEGLLVFDYFPYLGA